MKDCKLINKKNKCDDTATCDYGKFLDNIEIEVEEKESEYLPQNINDESIKTEEDWYFTYVLNKTDVLPKDEQIKLLNIYHNSENESEKFKIREILLETNQRLVVSIAKKYMFSGVSLDDLIQEGTIGLMKAIDKYDISTNLAISTYATYWIKQSIGKYIQEQGHSIRVPVKTLEKIYKFRGILSAAQRKGEKIPSKKELAKLIGCSTKQLTKIIYYSNIMETISLSSPIKGSKDGITEGLELQDSIPCPFNTSAEGNKDSEVTKMIHEEMKSMFDDRTYDLLCRRYGMNQYKKSQTLEEVGKIYGISKERVRQIQDRAEEEMFKSSRFRELIR